MLMCRRSGHVKHARSACTCCKLNARGGKSLNVARDKQLASNTLYVQKSLTWIVTWAVYVRCVCSVNQKSISHWVFFFFFTSDVKINGSVSFLELRSQCKLAASPVRSHCSVSTAVDWLKWSLLCLADRKKNTWSGTSCSVWRSCLKFTVCP